MSSIKFTRRKFFQAASLAVIGTTATSSVVHGQSSRRTRIKAGFPMVDGLCLDILENPEQIRASGLTAMLFDASQAEPVPTADGAPKWQRTFNSTLKSIVSTRQKLRLIPNVFLATNGSEIRQAYKAGKTAVFLQVQGGGEIVGDDLSRIDALHELGLRVLQITHHHNNPLGGGGLESKTSGLTKLGFEAVDRMNGLGVIPDLSHASDETAFDTLKTSKKPVILSHGAARALVNNARCAPDSVIRGIADSGGVMGVFMMSFWLTTDAIPTVDAYIKQIRHVIKVGGIDAVGIANDFPLAGEQSLIDAKGDNSEAVKNYWQWWDSINKMGVLGFNKRPTHVAIPELNNIRRMNTIREALERHRFRPAEIEKIMGANWIRVLTQ